jgi:WD40-like Beta Propeller Repeat
MATDDWTPRPRDEVLVQVRAEGDRRRQRRRAMTTFGIVTLVVLLAVPVLAAVQDDGPPATRVGTTDDSTTTTTVDEETTTTTSTIAGEATTTTAAAGAAPRPTTSTTAASYTGELIVFGRLPADFSSSNAFEAQTARPDGTEPRSLFTGRLPLIEMAWSPNGNVLAYIAGDAQSSALYTVDRDGNGTQALTGGERLSGLSWRPDSHAVGLMAGPDDAGSLIEVEVTTGDRRELMPDTVASGPTWSPDGKQLAVSVFEEEGDLTTAYVVAIDLTSGARRRVTNRTLGPERHPKWSPDGGAIALVAPSGFNFSSVFIVQASNPEQFVWLGNSQFQGAGPPSWSPDGARLVVAGARGFRDNCCYYADQSVFVANRDASGLHEVVDQATAPSWARRKR